MVVSPRTSKGPASAPNEWYVNIRCRLDIDSSPPGGTERHYVALLFNANGDLAGQRRCEVAKAQLVANVSLAE
jgi:hypothetical protein